MQDLSGNDYLVVDRGGHRSAVALKDVIRIEQLPATRMERLGRRLVLNFGGQILPIEDSADLLARVEADPASQIVVVICRSGGCEVGFVVSHVLDVAAGTDLLEAGSSRAREGVTLLENRVTELFDLATVLPLSDTGRNPQGCELAEAIS